MHRARTTQRQRQAALMLTLAGSCGPLAAQTAPIAPTADSGNEAVVVTGSRSATTALKSLAPVQVVGGDALLATGEPDLRRALAAVAPSYLTIQSNGGGLLKGAGASSLRGLSGNQVLYLVNGRRRHGSSLINNRGGASIGSSAADIGHIPVAAVQRVEVLTDGAAAQYGSDAIAGVINVILKSDSSGGSAEYSIGEYNHDTAKLGGIGDAGRTQTLNANQGFELGDRGFLNLSLSALDVGLARTQGAWKAPSRTNLQLYGAAGDPREATASRWVHTATVPFPEQQQGNAAYNLQLELPNDITLYSYGTLSSRDTRTPGSYRTETNGTSHVVTTPGGYGPSLKVVEQDWQVDAGARGKNLLGWAWDAGLSLGSNRADVTILNTINASFGPTVPLQDMGWGDLKFTEALLSLTVNRGFNTSLADPLRVTAGAEYRRNTLKLGAGDPLSYENGGYRYPDDYPAVNLRGTLAGVGSAFMTGTSPDFAFDEQRHNQGVFIDFSQRFTPDWEAAFATRYERYSDFGGALSGKLSTRYQAAPWLALRGTVSNGFRAPSLAEHHYASAQVQPVNDLITGTSYVSYDYDTLRWDAPAASALGARALRPEKSNNFSIGAVFTPADRLSLTIDLYRIDIRDRIYLTGSFNGFNNAAVASLFRNAGLTTEQTVKFFTNIGNTRTQGLEFKADYSSRHGRWGNATWGLTWGYNDTKVTRINTPAVLQQAGLSLLGRDRIVQIEEGLPRNVVRGSVNWVLGKWRLNVVESWYDKTRTVNNVTNPAQDSITSTAFITDASLSYDVTPQLRVTLGSRNLFNKKADNTPESIAFNQSYENPTPLGSTPYGTAGAFYYARLNYQW